MKQFIWKTFVKGYEDTKDPVVRRRYTRLTGVLGIIVNALLCGAKIVLGLLSGSIAVIADGLHDMADSLAPTSPASLPTASIPMVTRGRNTWPVWSSPPSFLW